ncbi:MAG TPA: group III truncated hemoglobin [Mycobacteriales bacterium]|nr:group III truncated hemoglobin [Mycobacteriales bacterium]
MPGTDIRNRDDIFTLVETFYRRAFADPDLGPIFVDIVKLDLDEHLPVMCDFWESVLMRAGTYHRNALEVHRTVHAKAPLDSALFARWVEIWTATVDDLHTGPRAEQAKLQASRVAFTLNRRLTGTDDEELLPRPDRAVLAAHRNTVVAGRASLPLA